MSGDIRGPSQQEMGTSAGREFKSPETAALVHRTLLMAEQLAGNKLRPELVEALSEVMESGDPAAIDALDPDNERSKKHLSEQAKGNLQRAWGVIESKK
jgi:hypothetical protein